MFFTRLMAVIGCGALALLFPLFSLASETTCGQPATTDSPHRVIALAPNLAELAYAAGLGEQLIATVDYSDYPEPALELPRIGDAFRFDYERIVNLNPSLILAWEGGNSEASLKQLEQLDLNLLRLSFPTPSSIADALETLATYSVCPEQGQAAATAVRERIAQLEATYQHASPIRYFYQIAERPLYTISESHLISEGLSLCQGVNVFAGLPGLAPTIGFESVLAAKPDALLAPASATVTGALAQWLAWPEFRPVAMGNLYYLSADPISRATPRFVDALEQACHYLDRARNNINRE